MEIRLFGGVTLPPLFGDSQSFIGVFGRLYLYLCLLVTLQDKRLSYRREAARLLRVIEYFAGCRFSAAVTRWTRST